MIRELGGKSVVCVTWTPLEECSKKEVSPAADISKWGWEDPGLVGREGHVLVVVEGKGRNEKELKGALKAKKWKGDDLTYIMK